MSAEQIAGLEARIATLEAMLSGVQDDARMERKAQANEAAQAARQQADPEIQRAEQRKQDLEFQDMLKRNLDGVMDEMAERGRAARELGFGAGVPELNAYQQTIVDYVMRQLTEAGVITDETEIIDATESVNRGSGDSYDAAPVECPVLHVWRPNPTCASANPTTADIDVNPQPGFWERNAVRPPVVVQPIPGGTTTVIAEINHWRIPSACTVKPGTFTSSLTQRLLFTITWDADQTAITKLIRHQCSDIIDYRNGFWSGGDYAHSVSQEELIEFHVDSTSLQVRTRSVTLFAGAVFFNDWGSYTTLLTFADCPEPSGS